jgi:hypothetical protein
MIRDAYKLKPIKGYQHHFAQVYDDEKLTKEKN